jgi:hypothetical protein
MMRKSSPALPPQLRCILQTEGKAVDPEICLKNIKVAKEKELHSYLSLVQLRLDLLPSDLTSKPPV